MGANYPRSRDWHLNNYLLEVLGMYKQVRLEIKDFFEWHQGNTSVAIVRDSFKAYICTMLIAFRVSREKKRGLGRANLLATIQKLEAEIKQKVSLEGTWRL